MVLLSESAWLRAAEAKAFKSAGSTAAKIANVTSISTSVNPFSLVGTKCLIGSLISFVGPPEMCADNHPARAAKPQNGRARLPRLYNPNVSISSAASCRTVTRPLAASTATDII